MSIREKIHEFAVVKHRPHVWFHSGDDDAWRCWFCGATYEASPWINDQVCHWEYRPRHAVLAARITSGVVGTQGWSI
jgi:hypothetical protein